MTVETKADRGTIDVPFECKAEDVNFEERTFEGLAASFGTVDAVMDVIHKGAFKRTLSRWRQSGKRGIPLLDNHAHITKMNPSVTDILGKPLDLKETDAGLFGRWQVAKTRAGDDVLNLLADGMADTMSIGFRMMGDPEIDPDTGIRHLREIKLLETSLPIFAANDFARVDSRSVKSLTEVELPAGDLTEEDRTQLFELKDRIGALLAGPGLAPDSPQRLDGEAMLRELTLRGIGPRA